MTSSRTTSRPTFDRVTDSILDRNGDIYGVDERERSIWYEAIAIAASVQWLVFPWVIAIMSWNVGRDTASILGWILLAFYLPMLVANLYVHRNRVASLPLRWSRKRVVITAITSVPLVVASLGIQRAHHSFDKYSVFGGIFGGCVGLALSVFLMRYFGKRRQMKLAAPQDLD